MAFNSFRSNLKVILVSILLITFLPVRSVKALNSHDDALLPLDAFISQLTNSEGEELRGIYIPGSLAALIVQQPAGIEDFVSPSQNIVTQFDLASQFGSTGLLAHNYLAGERFSHLKRDQKIYLIYGDGSVSVFVVTAILRYQALEPTNASSAFVDLDSRDSLTASELFLTTYNRPGQVILQTCITKDNNLNWGRLFVIAEPYFLNS